jgi:hypothetical protein
LSDAAGEVALLEEVRHAKRREAMLLPEQELSTRDRIPIRSLLSAQSIRLVHEYLALTS